MDNYVLRLKPEAVRKLIDALRIKFNSSLQYRSRFCSQDTLIRLKAQELADYVLGKRSSLDLGEPKPDRHRTDSEVIRSRILSMTTAEARKRGISKNTMWYLRQRAPSPREFSIYGKVRTKLCS